MAQHLVGGGVLTVGRVDLRALCDLALHLHRRGHERGGRRGDRRRPCGHGVTRGRASLVQKSPKRPKPSTYFI